MSKFPPEQGFFVRLLHTTQFNRYYQITTAMKNEGQNRISFSMIFAILFFGGLFILICVDFYRDRRMENEPVKYTTAVIVDFARGARVAPWFDYEFSIDGQRYESRYSIANKLRKENNTVLRAFIGRQFLVRFNADNPNSLHRLMLECPVPDSIEVTPPQGWEKRPFKCGEEIE